MRKAPPSGRRRPARAFAEIRAGARQFHACMTLFGAVGGGRPFNAALARFCNGARRAPAPGCAKASHATA